MRRIEAAIEHKDVAELKWALGYCNMRLKIPPVMKQHRKTWQHMKDRVQAVLDESLN
jgi:hypothetical protein